MKNPTVKILFAASLILLLSTQCSDELLDKLINDKGITNKVRLSEMIHNGRQYQFTYDNKGHVDLITVLEGDQTIYSYDITYKKKQLVSAELIEDGDLVSKNSDFQFDDDGNIVKYTYTLYVEDVPGGVATDYQLEYDDQSRLVSISTGDGTTGHELIYDSDDNVTRWTTPYSERAFTYDEKINPLNMVPDLFFLLVEETSFWEFIVSEQNSVTKSEVTTSTMAIENTAYKNEYDKYFRLVRKTDEKGNEFTFVYD